MHRREPRVFVDLLCASSGIEQEIVGAVERLRMLGAEVKVATVDHLIATKVLSRDDSRPPRDRQDLVNRLKIATCGDIEDARRALELMEDRGFSRGRDLRAELAAARREFGSTPPG